MDLSIVIPLIDEAESLPELTAWIEKVMHDNNYSYDVSLKLSVLPNKPLLVIFYSEYELIIT